MSTTKCSEYVIDIDTKRARKCKNAFKFIIRDCKFCRIHANINYNIYISRIQAAFHGMQIRKKIKKIRELPDDLQKTIIQKVRDEFVNSRQNIQLSNFLIKKFQAFIFKLNNHITDRYFEGIILNNFSLMNQDQKKQFTHILYLNNKYKSILNYNTKYTIQNTKFILNHNSLRYPYIYSIQNMLKYLSYKNI